MKTAFWVLLAIVVWLPALGMAQERDPAKILGLTKETRSLPPWEEPGLDARTALGKFARAAERGVFLVGNRVQTDKYVKAGIGTAWCISRKHRLLVTNAHVADMKHELETELFAIPSGSSQRYKVEKYYYHPGVHRYLGGDKYLSVRSMDPKEGGVDPASPDLAILQLSPEGPELTFEFTLATEDELRGLFAASVAMFGFPGHDNPDNWPKRDTAKVAATFHDGVISRISDFNLNPDVPHARLLQLQYTMAGWGGFSGSPVFLPNGHVVAAHNMSRTAERGEVVKAIAHGVRSDLVLEMLVHHGLADQVPFPIDKAAVDVARWTMPDEQGEKTRADLAAAQKLVAEGRNLFNGTGDLNEVAAKCNAALKLVPTYAAAYRLRSSVNGTYYFRNWKKLSVEQAEPVLRKAHSDALTAAKLVPTTDHALHATTALKNLAFLFKDNDKKREVIATATKVIDSPNSSVGDRAYGFLIRAGAYDNLDLVDKARADYDESIRLFPENPVYWENRAVFLEDRGYPVEAARDRAKAKELRIKRSTGNGNVPPPPPAPGF